jgi:hypothetical protein
MRRVKNSLLLILLLLFSLPSLSADPGDIFIEIQVGPRFEHTAEVMSGLSTGYVFMHNLSIGVAVDQYFALVEGLAETEGISFGADMHWFFEPFEASWQLGYFLASHPAATSRASLAASLIYLFALTPAVAAKAEVRARHLINESTTKLFWGLGARILF